VRKSNHLACFSDCRAGAVRQRDGPGSGGFVDVTALTPPQRKIAMVFQSYALFPHLRRGRKYHLWLGVRGPCQAPGARPSRLKARCRHGRRVCSICLSAKPRTFGRPAQAMGLEGHHAEAVSCLMDETPLQLGAKLRNECVPRSVPCRAELGMTMVYVTHDQTRGDDHGRSCGVDCGRTRRAERSARGASTAGPRQR